MIRSFHLFDKSNYLLAIIYYMIVFVKEILVVTKTLSGQHQPGKMLTGELFAFRASQVTLLVRCPERSNHDSPLTRVGCHHPRMERIPGSARCYRATTHPRTTGAAGRAQLTLGW